MVVKKFIDKFKGICIECTKLGVGTQIQEDTLKTSINSTYPLVSEEASKQFTIQVIKNAMEYSLEYTYSCEILFSSELKNELAELYPEKLI